MNNDIFEGKWKQFVGAAKQHWGKLTDDDWTFINGKREELIGKIQERYGITREQAQKEAEEWARHAQVQAEREHLEHARTTGKV